LSYNFIMIKKVLITGGHLSPAISLIEEIKKRDSIDIVFVGRKYALDSEKTISLEYKEIVAMGIRFITLSAGRLTRVMNFRSIMNILRVPIGFVSAFLIVMNEKPDLIFSFGGFLALPIAFWGHVFKIKVFSHEQTINPGLANRIISFFSNKVFCAFKEAERCFPKSKTVVCGNPIRESIYKTDNKPFFINSKKPVIYVTGGSLGSHSINLHIEKLLDRLLLDYVVIHQTGDTREYGDFERILEKKKKLNKDISKNYYLRKHFYRDEIGFIYSMTTLCVGRSGANTFFELMALKIPAVLIPLPWSAGKEQQKHAEIFAKMGLGEIFHQIEPSEKLLRLIRSMTQNIGHYRKNFNYLDQHYKINATKFLADQVLEHI